MPIIQFSEYAEALQPSPIREILQVIREKPNIISLAGGLPNPATFPSKEEIQKLIKKIDVSFALQYGTTRGVKYFREQVLNFLKRFYGIESSLDEIIIINGAQQGLNILPKILANPGNYVVVEGPTYLGALIPFERAGVKLVEVPLEEDGIDLDYLENLVKKYDVKFFYTIPTYQNPSGISMSEEKRKELVKFANEYNLIIVEDDPYGALSYGKEYKPLKYYSKDVIYLGTASKIFAPGPRVGWMVAPKEIIDKVELEKQGEDLCTSTLSQYLIGKYFESNRIYSHIEEIRKFYKPRRDLMNELLETYVDAEWVTPDGGMFFWLKTNKNTRKIFDEAIRKGVAYVPGDAFFVNKKYNYMRLNFTYAPEEDMEKGIKIIGELLND